MNIQIYPLDKVVFDNVSICLGMEKKAVELALGVGEAIGNRYYYFNSEMAIDYQENKVNFIEFLGGSMANLSLPSMESLHLMLKLMNWLMC